MKRKYLILLIVCFMAVVSVQGLALDFQYQTDLNSIATFSSATSGNATINWVQSPNGGNSYLNVNGTSLDGVTFSGFGNRVPFPMTYAACTVAVPPTWQSWISLYDSNGTLLWGYSILYGSAWVRWEMKMNGNVAKVYLDGVLKSTSPALTQNPSHVAFGGWKTTQSPGYDDCIWGGSVPRFIFGMPENGYFIMKDILNPAASGFYQANTTLSTGSPVLINSFNFTSTYGRNNGYNQTVSFMNLNGTIGREYYTGTSFQTYGKYIIWDVQGFVNSGAPYGLYYTTMQNQTDTTGFATSDLIPYIGSGASIQFDKNSYAVGETAILTTTITPAYYAAITSPHVKIQDVFGTAVVDDTSIVFALMPNGDRVGTTTHTWTAADADGVYFGLVYGTYGGNDILMNYDTADLTGILIVNGYVFNAENATVISGARVNITQGVTTDSVSSGTDGNYTSTSAFIANQPTTIVASKTGYETYQHVFTPLYAGAIQINLTLMPNSPIHAGYAVGGLARTPPYNRSISSASIEIVNSTDYNLTTTNSVGYYLQNNLTAAKQYNVSGSKTGFSNSSIYSVRTTNNWTRQDVMMDGIYTLTLNIKDATTLAGIPGATIMTSNGDNTTSNLLGVATISSNYTALVVSVGATGYYSRSISYVIDRDRTETIYLTTAPTVSNGTPLTYYSPWQVRIRIADFNGNPLPGTNVTASYVASTLPSTSISWLVNAFGINSDVATEMTNSGIAMAGITDSNGGLSFVMFKSIMYSLAISNATAGISSTKTLYPSDQEYLIRVALPGQVAYNNTLSQMANTSLPVYQLNATAYNLSVIYHDTSGLTTNVQFQVKWRNGTFLYNQSLGHPGTGVVVGNYTILNPGIGKEVIWLFNATRSGT